MQEERVVRINIGRMRTKVTLLGTAGLCGAVLLGLAGGRYTQAGITSFYQDKVTGETDHDARSGPIYGRATASDTLMLAPSTAMSGDPFALTNDAEPAWARGEVAIGHRREHAVDRPHRSDPSLADSDPSSDGRYPGTPEQTTVWIADPPEPERSSPVIPEPPPPEPLP